MTQGQAGGRRVTRGPGGARAPDAQRSSGPGSGAELQPKAKRLQVWHRREARWGRTWETFVSGSYFSCGTAGAAASSARGDPQARQPGRTTKATARRRAAPGPAPRSTAFRPGLRAPLRSRRRRRRHSPTFQRPQRRLLPRIPAPTKESLRPRAAAGGGGAARRLRAHIPPPRAPLSGPRTARGRRSDPGPAPAPPRPAPRGPGAGSGYGRTMRRRGRSGGGKPRRR